MYQYAIPELRYRHFHELGSVSRKTLFLNSVLLTIDYEAALGILNQKFESP